MIGSIIGAASSLFGAKKARDAADRQYERERWASKLEYQRQKEFAKKGTGWAFEDLMKSADQAGIHRLAALGASGAGAQYSPSSTQPGPGTAPPSVFAGNEEFIGDAVGEAIGRIANTEEYRYKRKMRDLSMERAEAEIREINAATSRSQIAAQRAASTAPLGQQYPTTPPQTPAAAQAENPLAPESYYHQSGPYAGHYVIPMHDGQYAIPANKIAPAEVYAALTGEISGEVAGAINLAGARKIKRPGGPKGPKRKGSPGETVTIGDTVWVWSRASNSWKPRKEVKP